MQCHCNAWHRKRRTITSTSFGNIVNKEGLGSTLVYNIQARRYQHTSQAPVMPSEEATVDTLCRSDSDTSEATRTEPNLQKTLASQGELRQAVHTPMLGPAGPEGCSQRTNSFSCKWLDRKLRSLVAGTNQCKRWCSLVWGTAAWGCPNSRTRHSHVVQRSCLLQVCRTDSLCMVPRNSFLHVSANVAWWYGAVRYRK